MRITESQLRRAIRKVLMENVEDGMVIEGSSWFDDDRRTSVVGNPANGKIEVTVNNDMFDFTPDKVKSLEKKAGTVYSDDYDEDEGCMLYRDKNNGPFKVSVHKSGKSFTDEIVTRELIDAMNEFK